MIGFVAAALMAAWGLFIRLNRCAEELESEAIDRVQSEDHKVTIGGKGVGLEEEA